jgi:hypothetical protein
VWKSGGVLFLALKMSQNSIDDVLVFYTSDNPQRTATAAASLDNEYAFQALGPVHFGMTLGAYADF